MGLTNNDIFKKLRVAHKMTNDDISKIFELVDFKVSKSELGAIFRREDHPKYKECGDQYLRNFLDGLIIHLRGPKPGKNDGRQKEKAIEYPTKKDSTKKKRQKKKKRPRVNRNHKTDE